MRPGIENLKDASEQAFGKATLPGRIQTLVRKQFLPAPLAKYHDLHGSFEPRSRDFGYTFVGYTGLAARARVF